MNLPRVIVRPPPIVERGPVPQRRPPVRFNGHGLSDTSQEPGRIQQAARPHHAPKGRVTEAVTTEAEAIMLAMRLIDHWRAKGHPEVKAWPVYQEHGGYCVRSNLVGGLPPVRTDGYRP